MRGDFPDDTFTQADVQNELDRAGLKHIDKGRYLLSQCPTHDDEHPSVQIYKDDWFVNCHAGCGRFHITKAFPSLREAQKGWQGSRVHSSRPTQVSEAKKVSEHKYKTYDLMEDWKKMPLIPRDHYFKNIPLEVLDDLGWRMAPDGQSYFIPYFSASKQSIPFAQYRHLQGARRFTMLKDAKPTCYGTWNLDNHKLFVVEGTSDAAVLEACAVPWIALPSAASGELLKAMAGYCKENGIELVFAGDNDEAGLKLRDALDEVMPYRVKQARQPYKDWGDMYEAEGQESVTDYCFEELFGRKMEITTYDESGDVDLTDLERVQKVFPGAEELVIVGDGQESKEQSDRPPGPF